MTYPNELIFDKICNKLIIFTLRFNYGNAAFFSDSFQLVARVHYLMIFIMETAGKKCTFEQMPELLSMLIERVEAFSDQLQYLHDCKRQNDWMDINELREYLPGSVSRTTIYTWIREMGFPYYKKVRILYFYRPEVDKWLMEGLVNKR